MATLADGVRRLVTPAGVTGAVSLLVLLLLLMPIAARADGDPGSDVLLDQNLFYGTDSGITVGQELALGRLLDATAAVGVPVRVAIIAHRDDLGAVTSLWRQPQGYAAYLGSELSLVYPGRLLVVMPNGFGFYRHGHSAAAGYAALTGVRAPAGAGPAALTAATQAAVARLERGAGISAAALAAAQAHAGSAAAVRSPPPAADAGTAGAAPLASTPSVNGDGVSDWVVALALGVVVAGGFSLAVAGRRRDRLRIVRRRLAAGGGARSPRLTVGVTIGIPVLAIAVLAGILQLHGGATVSGTLADNPDVDPGSTLPLKPAPNFRLVDETGQPVSLSQYRGKVVILSFIDAECQTICPMTTTAMLDAKRALGPAGRQVVLLAVNANWRSTQVDDVLNYTELHGMSGQWHFLTGSLAQLNRVWTAYGLNEYKLEEKAGSVSSLIDHVAATFVIDPQGRQRTLYTTQGSYGAIPQLGQLLAQEASRLLSSHPRVKTHYSYAEVTGTAPTTTVSLPRASGGTITLGPGRGHLFLFFASWDRQTTPLAADLDSLNRYERLARVDGLPRVIAIDEGSVEPSPRQLPELLRSLPASVDYPVAIDTTGRVADGYGVEGEPWFVLTDAAGRVVWYQEVYTAGWPSVSALVGDVRGALSHSAGQTTPAAIARRLAGSPAPLAALHEQASEVLTGGQRALDARISALRGYPIVLNVWGSWCEPCQSEFHLFAEASADFGRRVAFLGSDTDDPSPSGQEFLHQHPVSYPSYETTPQSMDALLAGGLEGTPTTIYIAANGRHTHINIGPYESEGALDHDIETYALG